VSAPQGPPRLGRAPRVVRRAWIPAPLAVAAAVMGTGAAGCGEGPAPRSAVLITLDTTRLDALGVFGGPQGLTPNLDALAARSLRYEWARTVAPLTLPAHASMMTGLYPPRHTARGNGPSVLPAEAVTLAEEARAAGFQTAAFVACLALDRALGIDQGFDTWSQPAATLERRVGEIADRPGGEVVGEALGWLASRDPRRPFFLWVHLFDPHAPYEPQPRFPGAPSPYHGEVAAMDAAVGRLLDAIEAQPGLAEEVFVAVVADHGEGLGDGGEATHGLLLRDATVRVPLLLRYRDGWGAGKTSNETVSVADVGPTLLEAMGLAVREGLDGISLYRRSVPAERGVYFESYDGWRRYGWSPLAGWADAEGKYVRGARDELHRTRADPREVDDVLARGEPLPRRYAEGIAALARRRALPSAGDRTVGDEVLAAMAELGYGATYDRPPSYPAPFEVQGRPDPRDSLAESTAVDRARDLALAGDHAAARAILEAVHDANPYDTTALDLLAEVLIALGEHRPAVAVLRARLVLPPEQIATHRDLVRCFTALGDAAQRRVHSLRALELLIETHERRGEHEEAARYRELLEGARAEGG